ncbi:MAG: hypothetical protein O2931_14025, partial [Planctomycetota bacterium]|nr:hypothetical protein [Planctomycetota bacterium]
SVTSLGIVSGNRQWQVSITPDASLFSNQPAGLGGSIAAEVGFSVTGTTFVSGTKNAASWPFDNPGNNPFTSTVTNGISLNGNTLFASLGSTFFTSATPVTLLTLVTQGTGPTTVAWGGQTLLTGTPQEYVGGRLAQGGQNFNNITGSISSTIPCDLNGDGRVDGADVGLLFNSWGNVAPGTAADKDNSGVVDGADLAAIFNNWTGDVGPTAAVPEPCALGSLVFLAAILGAARNRSRVVT